MEEVVEDLVESETEKPHFDLFKGRHTQRRCKETEGETETATLDQFNV